MRKLLRIAETIDTVPVEDGRTTSEKLQAQVGSDWPGYIPMPREAWPPQAERLPMSNELNKPGHSSSINMRKVRESK